ncbi:hypothetical protein BCR44DRAFT_1537514 [Catenaria anguillulae PL171]|uniref:MULE transposase domain-containing protein n=1 Tax=Catenaria anguillulae PL171 TaxID=765915 RepID=A0A1Y2HDB7_9FUNG|nr:hypothetical protein BCR44DRAFT_1537514 [Catenaria anguillulae PL171]
MGRPAKFIDNCPMAGGVGLPDNPNGGFVVDRFTASALIGHPVVKSRTYSDYKHKGPICELCRDMIEGPGLQQAVQEGNHGLRSCYLACCCSNLCTKTFVLKVCDRNYELKHCEEEAHTETTERVDPARDGRGRLVRRLMQGLRGLSNDEKSLVDLYNIRGRGVKAISTDLLSAGLIDATHHLADPSNHSKISNYIKEQNRNARRNQYTSIEALYDEHKFDPAIDVDDANRPYLAIPNEDDGIGFGTRERLFLMLAFTETTLTNLSQVAQAVGGMDKAVISFDGTSKTNEMGYQLFVIAVNNLGHQAHTVAYEIMSHRSEDTYLAVLNKLFEVIRAVVVDDDYDTTAWEVTMSDAGDAIACA